MSRLKFLNLDDTRKKILLDILGYAVDEEGFVLNKETGNRHRGPFSEETVKLEEAFVLPGSTIVDKTDALTMSDYISRYRDNDE